VIAHAKISQFAAMPSSTPSTGELCSPLSYTEIYRDHYDRLAALQPRSR